MNFMEQRERYLHDPEFHALVDRIYYLLLQGQFTISELKEAVVFASFKFESEQILPFFPRMALDKKGRIGKMEYAKVGETKEGEGIYRELVSGQIYVEKEYQYLTPATREEKQKIEK